MGRASRSPTGGTSNRNRYDKAPAAGATRPRLSMGAVAAYGQRVAMESAMAHHVIVKALFSTLRAAARVPDFLSSTHFGEFTDNALFNYVYNGVLYAVVMWALPSTLILFMNIRMLRHLRQHLRESDLSRATHDSFGRGEGQLSSRRESLVCACASEGNLSLRVWPCVHS